MFLYRLSVPFNYKLSLPYGSFFNFEYENSLVGIEVKSIEGKFITSYSNSLEWMNAKTNQKAVIHSKKNGVEEPVLEIYFNDKGIDGSGFVQPRRFSYLNIYFEDFSLSNIKEIDLSPKKSG